jgi:hypothetical protein
METLDIVGLLFKPTDILVIPATIVIILLLFRRPLSRIFERLTRVEIKGLDLQSLESAGIQAPIEKDTGRPDLTKITESPKEKLEKLRLVLESEQVNQVVQYHAQSLAQSRKSFWFSIGAATFGFLVIVLGVTTLFFGVYPTPSYASIGAGIIIDAVAALFFTQSNRARKQMTEFFDKLRRDRQFNESLRLCNSITDEYIQSLLKVQLSLFFAGVPTGEDIAQKLASVQPLSSRTSSDISPSNKDTETEQG